MKPSLPAMSALTFGFVVFLVSYVNRGPLFFIGLLVFACAFAAVQFSYAARSTIV